MEQSAEQFPPSLVPFNDPIQNKGFYELLNQTIIIFIAVIIGLGLGLGYTLNSPRPPKRVALKNPFELHDRPLPCFYSPKCVQNGANNNIGQGVAEHCGS